jgi:hypothetical protein
LVIEKIDYFKWFGMVKLQSAGYYYHEIGVDDFQEAHGYYNLQQFVMKMSLDFLPRDVLILRVAFFKISEIQYLSTIIVISY